MDAKKPIFDEIKKQNEHIKLKKEQIIESVAKINSEDMDENISKRAHELHNFLRLQRHEKHLPIN